MSDASDAGPAPRRFLSDLSPGERTDEAYVISGVQLKTNKRGDPYLTMLVSDRTRSVSANWWDQGEAMFRRLPNPGVVRLKAVVEEFNGRPQLKVEKILQIRDPETVDYGELLAKTDKDVDAMFAELEAMLQGLTSPTLRGVAEAYLGDERLMSDFRKAPAAMAFHHAFLGGLLEHTLNAMRAADRLAPLYPGLNRDLCVLGVFVHDLAKTWELSYETGFDYTSPGRLIGHIVKGAMWVADKAADASPPVPEELVDVLQHIVLSHHGEHELGFGSAKSPSTPEAIFVHMVENLDAKMTMALSATRTGEASGDPSSWTPFMKSLNTRLLKTDVAAAADSANASLASAPSGLPGPSSNGDTTLF